jgi:phenylpropionate dioxygenase-like ring-hydroxylating dioxygenase large terminal subunit
MVDVASKDPLARPYPTVQDLLTREDKAVPVELTDTAHDDSLGLGGVAASVYVGREQHQREIARLWGRVWQMACREDELRRPGDHVLYEIGFRSVIVTRSQDGQIRAFHNVCRHRGRRLREGGGTVKAFRCPFHGFTWNLDGSLRAKPCEWDFPNVTDADFGLIPVRAETWGGFVFVCFDPDAPPLLAQLEDIPAIFRRHPPEQRHTTAHVEKVIRCNWKIALEAFIETLHVTDTHPQIAAYIGDAHTQYDTWPGKRHYNRMISPRGLPSPSQGVLSEEMIFRASEPGVEGLDLPEGATARRAMADRKRARLSQSYGQDLEWLTDSEAVDTIQYFIFPNLVCWWGHGSPINYRFRPNGDREDECLMEIIFLVPDPLGSPKPAPAKVTRLGPDDSWTLAPEIGPLGAVADQDTGNMEGVHRGLKSGALEHVTLSRYAENRIRHFHRTLADYVGGQEPTP